MHTTLNLADPSFLKDRRASYRHLRLSAPVAESELNGEPVVVVTRHADVTAILQDRRATMAPVAGEFPAYLGEGPAALFYRLSLPSVDDPDHMRLRRIVSPAFTPQSVSHMESWVTEIIDQRIADLQGQPVIDAVAALSDTIPVDVACRLFHIPRADGKFLVGRANDMIAILSQANLRPGDLERADESAKIYFAYFQNLVESNRHLPDIDIVGALSRAEGSGALSSDQVGTLLLDIFLGSYHTTMVSFTNAIAALARYPDQRAALIANPSLAARTWEELLRFDSPVHFRHRYVSEPLTLHGYEIKPRIKVMLALASANWDETAFEEPDRFDISRPTNRHVTFGGGGHFCLGSQLSRLEGKIFLPRFLARFPDFRLVDGDEPVRNENLTFPYLERLPIELTGTH